RWATRNGAAVAGRSDELGSIESGYLADLLVVDGDPSQDLAVLTERENLSAIMK
ncbi:MAG: amidohydrolase family protein, partial [Actinobacteria bacterium]|nr:amidohydrolase family protein [Actinomycetota bacterium]